MYLIFLLILYSRHGYIFLLIMLVYKWYTYIIESVRCDKTREIKARSLSRAPGPCRRRSVFLPAFNSWPQFRQRKNGKSSINCRAVARRRTTLFALSRSCYRFSSDVTPSDFMNLYLILSRTALCCIVWCQSADIVQTRSLADGALLHSAWSVRTNSVAQITCGINIPQ